VSIVVTILLVILALVAGLVSLVVAAPFRVRAAGVLSDDEVHGVVTGTWLLGLVGLYAASHQGVFLLLFGRPVWRFEPDGEEKKAEKKAKKADKRRKKKEKKKEKKKKAKKTVADRATWFRSHGSTLGRLALRALSTLRLRLRIDGTIGLADPADTAALMTALRMVERRSAAAWIDVQPDYLDETTDLEGEVSARLWILAILGFGLRSLFEVRTWKLLRGLV
jgi:hypothetical protein